MPAGQQATGNKRQDTRTERQDTRNKRQETRKREACGQVQGGNHRIRRVRPFAYFTVLIFTYFTYGIWLTGRRANSQTSNAPSNQYPCIPFHGSAAVLRTSIPVVPDFCPLHVQIVKSSTGIKTNLLRFATYDFVDFFRCFCQFLEVTADLFLHSRNFFPGKFKVTKNGFWWVG